MPILSRFYRKYHFAHFAHFAQKKLCYLRPTTNTTNSKQLLLGVNKPLHYSYLTCQNQGKMELEECRFHRRSSDFTKTTNTTLTKAYELTTDLLSRFLYFVIS